MTDANHPRPSITDIDRPFWEGAAKHEFLVQACADCGRVRWPPSPLCPSCWSERKSWIELDGEGTVNTWAVYYQRVHKAFMDDVPYTVVEVELDHGVRYISTLVDAEDADLSRGMPVQVVYDRIDTDLTLPKFEPAD
jgi:uncharacterized OB-fold protein